MPGAFKESEAAMNYNIILAGVGGQGGLSVSVLIAQAALSSGFFVKQSEVHGMSQRGGEVVAHLRIADYEIQSPTIPKGDADLILAFEPLEALRYLPWLSASRGMVVSSSTPIRNFSAYPDTAEILAELKNLPNYRILDAETIAKQAGNTRAANVCLLGAAADLLPLKPDSLKKEIETYFSAKGEAVVQANLSAFEEGRKKYAS
jgi:indolepyruvate ferredoxin oxidoreductase beta subunit